MLGLVLGGMLMTLASFTAMPGSGQTPAPEEIVVATEAKEVEEEYLPVIGWFWKRDTMTYWIHEGEWQVSGPDTVKTFGLSTKVQVTVTDSTKNRYRMEYRFLELGLDPEVESWNQHAARQVFDKVEQAVVGTTIKFRTDALGHIVRYDNLGAVKRQAKKLWADILDDATWLDSLTAAGLNVEQLLRAVDADALVDGYIEELELLFHCHGNQYQIGEFTEHSDETDTEYASDTYVMANLDPDTYQYEMLFDVYSYIPRADIKSMLGDVFDLLIEDEEDAATIKQQLATGFDEQVTEDAVYNSCLYFKFFPDGWPEEVINQEGAFIGDRGKLRQKYIEWEYRSVGHTN